MLCISAYDLLSSFFVGYNLVYSLSKLNAQARYFSYVTVGASLEFRGI